MPETLQKTQRIPADPLGVMAMALSKHIASMSNSTSKSSLTHVLREMLDGESEESRLLRTALQIHLVKVSNQPAFAKQHDQQVQDVMLSTEEAAQLMGRSRPWVAMLIDAKVLSGATVTSGGHRKVPRASVLKWLESNKTKEMGNKDYRQAGVDADIYSVDDAVFVKRLKDLKKRA